MADEQKYNNFHGYWQIKILVKAKTNCYEKMLSYIMRKFSLNNSKSIFETYFKTIIQFSSLKITLTSDINNQMGEMIEIIKLIQIKVLKKLLRYI
jgi:hypothetical protein